MYLLRLYLRILLSNWQKELNIKGEFYHIVNFYYNGNLLNKKNISKIKPNNNKT